VKFDQEVFAMSMNLAGFDLIVIGSPEGKASLVGALIDIKARTGLVTERDVKNICGRLGLRVADAEGVAGLLNNFDFDSVEEPVPKKGFDPWKEAPCKLWNNGR
jgi:hypothetical protein